MSAQEHVFPHTELCDFAKRAAVLGYGHGDGPLSSGEAKMRKALVVEEMPELAGFVAAVFERLEIEAFVVETVAEAIEILDADGQFEAVFISTNGGKAIDAPELSRLIKARWPEIEIFVSSARLERLHELPPCVFIAKPLNPSTLIEIITHVVRTRPTSDRDGHGSRGGAPYC
jgi:DNA-binding NtrC family response regulator